MVRNSGTLKAVNWANVGVKRLMLLGGFSRERAGETPVPRYLVHLLSRGPTDTRYHRASSMPRNIYEMKTEILQWKL
jgi:hypothetical protein